MFNRFSMLGPLILAMLTVTDGSAQVGMEAGFWSWTPASKHHDAIVQVSLGDAIGTGVLVHVDKHKPTHGGFEGYCLTALHVVEDDRQRRNIKVTYRNGRRAKRCAVVEVDKQNDLALLWVWVPSEIASVPLANQAAVWGDELEFSGLGGGSRLQCCLRHFAGRAAEPTDAKVLYAGVALLPGDSGGPVFNAAGELVGIISGGWFWWNGGVKTDHGDEIHATWPARAANLGPIAGLVANVVDRCDQCEEAVAGGAVATAR